MYQPYGLFRFAVAMSRLAVEGKERGERTEEYENQFKIAVCAESKSNAFHKQVT
jgi:hypothetical protein